MAGFVKLDCGMLQSSIWFDRDVRDLFITALLMATPYEITVPTPTIATDSLEDGGMVVPPGWYGFVAAAGTGIVHRSMIDPKRGPECLKALASPEPDSRSPAFGGRRMVRINGGFLILNYINYREKDYTSKDRSKRWRERRRNGSGMSPAVPVVSLDVPKSDALTVTTRRDDTQADAEVRVQKQTPEQKAAPRKRVASVHVEKPEDVSQEAWDDWLIYRTKKGKPLTETAWKAMVREAGKAGWTVAAAVQECAERPWLAFKADWVSNKEAPYQSRPATGYVSGNSHVQNTPLGSITCQCVECVKYRQKHGIKGIGEV